MTPAPLTAGRIICLPVPEPEADQLIADKRELPLAWWRDGLHIARGMQRLRDWAEAELLTTPEEESLSAP